MTRRPSRPWTKSEERHLVRLHAGGSSIREISWALDREKSVIARRARISGLEFESKRQPWTAQQDEQLRARFANELTVRIAADLGHSESSTYQRARKLGLEKVEGWASRVTHERWLEGRHENSRKAHFHKGQVPPNKGLRRPGWSPGRMATTQFKKGARPHTWKPIGAERINADGYVDRKISDTGYPPRDWVGVHRLVWIEANGPIPPGHVVRFRDGQRTTDVAAITADKLELLTLAENMRRNSFRTTYPPELHRVIQLRGALHRQINKANRHEEQDRGPAQPPVRHARGAAGRRKADGRESRPRDR